MNASRWKASQTILVMLVTFAFVGGVSIGVIGDRLARRVDRSSTRITTDFSSVLDDLSLTREQRSRATAILERSAPLTEETMFEVAGRLQAISDSVDRELRAILTPSQRSRLDSLRRGPIFLLKRVKANGNTSVDTVYPAKEMRPTLRNR
jgi:hypothetical protein